MYACAYVLVRVFLLQQDQKYVKDALAAVLPASMGEDEERKRNRDLEEKWPGDFIPREKIIEQLNLLHSQGDDSQTNPMILVYQGLLRPITTAL